MRLEVRLAAIAGLLALTAAGPLEPGKWHTFGTWRAVCDNTRRCTAFGFADPGQTGAWISVQKDPNGVPVVTAALIYTKPAAVLRLVFVGRDSVVIAGPNLDPDPDKDSELVRLIVSSRDAAITRGIVDRLRTARAVNLQTAPDSSIGVVLRGASAALDWIDVQQAGGARPPPLIALTSLTGPSPDAWAVPSPVARLAARSGCEPVLNESAPDPPDPQSFLSLRYTARVSAHTTLWAVPCREEFNNGTALFATLDDRAQQAHPVLFHHVNKIGPELFMPSFDPEAGTLTSFENPGRTGECGERARYGWDGGLWRLIDLQTMPECRQVSSAFWPSVFRSRQR